MNAIESPRTHLVVGDGVTAAAFIEGLDLSRGDTLIVVGHHASGLGRGIAYAEDRVEGPWRYAYLLNSPADDIDANFAAWLEANWDKLSDRMQGRQPDWIGMATPLVKQGNTYGLNAPRAFYGDFLAGQTKTVLDGFKAKGVTVQLIDDGAVDVAPYDDQLKIFLSSGKTLTADTVDIAPGGPSTQRIEGDDGPFAAHTLFGLEDRIAEHIKAGREVFCAGANATMLDVLRLCQSLLPEDQVNLVACSPSGGLPPPLVPRMPRKVTEPTLTMGHKTAESFLAEVWAAMEQARADGDEMREIRAGFRRYFLEHGLSKLVIDKDEARLVPGTLRHWFRGGTRDTILDFHRLMKLGKTRTVKGAVLGIDHLADGARVTTRDRMGNITVFDTGFVVNCSGAGPNSKFDPLTEQMLSQGWLSKCPVTGGLEVGEKCATGLLGVRHLSPATAVIGDEVMPMPLYDARLLREWAARANS